MADSNQVARGPRNKASIKDKRKIGTPTMDNGSSSVCHCSPTLYDGASPKFGTMHLSPGKNPYSS